jgi:hypothetical protein
MIYVADASNNLGEAKDARDSGFIGLYMVLYRALFPWLHRPQDPFSSGSISLGSTIIDFPGSSLLDNPRILVSIPTRIYGSTKFLTTLID